MFERLAATLTSDVLAAYVLAVAVFFHLGLVVFSAAWGRLVFLWLLRVVMQQIAARRELRLRIASTQAREQRQTMRQFLRRKRKH